MTNRQGDAVYFLVLATAAGVAWWATTRPAEAPAVVDLPDFSMPGLQLEVPFELPMRFVEFRSPVAPRLELSRDTEGVIVEVRQALLESSGRDAEDVDVASPAPVSPSPPTQLASVLD